ncbi:MAG: gp436 family protein [Terracidiphilus sp.]
MAYAQQSDLVPVRITQTELVQLTCDDNTATVNAAVVSGVLEEASGTVDSYCRSRYVTPLQQSDMVTARTLDIAVYLLFSRRRGGLQPTELVRQRYEDAIAFLKDVAACRASLDQPASAQSPQTSMGGAEVSQRDRHLQFSDRNIEGFI